MQKGGGHMNNLTNSFETRTFIGGLVLVLSHISKSMHEIFTILAVFMILDYVTGVLCGLIKNGGFDYKKGIKGFIKKLMYLVLILVAILLEFLIVYLTEKAGIILRIDGAIVTAIYVYLIGTEGLSIIQNLIILGIPVPPFIIKLFGLLRDESGEIMKK
jgi:toxin secretion/phage lysis holin